MDAPRLNELSLVSGKVKGPDYDPQSHGVGIVHLGLGAFHRAHQAAITDSAIAKAGGDWRIMGINLRSRRIVDALAPQNGLYTLIERGAEGFEGRIIGSIAGVIADDPQATLDALCDPCVRVVTLTVTEKGYGINRKTKGPDLNNPTFAADLAAPTTPKGVLGLLTAALIRRRNRGIKPFTVLCCDNLPDNGRFLRGGIIGFAQMFDEECASWIGQNVEFPSCMVDRITPATTERTLKDARLLTGFEDAAAIETEPFFQWVIEDRFKQGRPAWELGGAVFVDDVRPYEEMKLRMLNGTHSMLAYTGFLLGHRYVRDVMNDQSMVKLIDRHLAAAAAGLNPLPGMDLAAYAGDLKVRFRNPAIAHKTYQIAADGTEKLPQRIWMPALDAIEKEQDIRPYSFATALWMRYTLGEDGNSKQYALCDPREAEIGEALSTSPRSASAISSVLHDLPFLFPRELVNNAAWRLSVESILKDVLDNGVSAAVLKEVANIG